MGFPLRIIALLWVLCEAATVLVYLLIIPVGSVFSCLSLLGLLLSELMFFASIGFIKTVENHMPSLLFSAGAMTISGLCSVVLFLASLLLMVLPEKTVELFLSITLIDLLVYIVGQMLFFVLGTHFHDEDEKEILTVINESGEHSQSNNHPSSQKRRGGI